MLRRAACLAIGGLLLGSSLGAINLGVGEGLVPSRAGASPSPTFLASFAAKPERQPPQENPPEGSFADEISVSLVTIVVRVVDTWGRPILGLKPDDFRVRVGHGEIPVTAVDWISSGEGEETFPDVWERPAPALESSDEELAPLVPGRSRLVVFFVQADLNPTRISGQLRMRPYTRELLGTLLPGDQAAIVSFDSHLKLWQDFTQDRQATQAALDKAMLYSPEEEVPPAEPVSLAKHFDFAAARRAASPERALELTARAMETLPGEKTVVFLGWGLGRFGATGVRMTPDYKPAVRALAAAHASVFVLDVTSADSHSLEIGLENVAEATGGLYLKTFRLPGLAAKTLARTISGYYVLTLDRSSLGDEQGRIRIELREKSGTVLGRPVAVR